MVELIRIAAHGICELRPPRFQGRHLPVGTIQGMLPAPVFGGLGAAATRPMRACTSAKIQMHSRTKPPVTMPTAQPTCSSGRHRFDDIGPLPRLMAMILASAI